MVGRAYTTPFSVTSQFAFCGLPVRLDTYGGCSFRCTYCFARYRGGGRETDVVRAADPALIARIISRAMDADEKKLGVIGQFLRRRVPLHFGGMSDPFQPIETRLQVTSAVLRVLAHYQYPTVISTRAALVASEPYLSLLKGIGPLVVQFSFSTTEDRIAQRIEPRGDPPRMLLAAMTELAGNGINVTCRWQPYIPGLSEGPREFVRRIASTGCKHVALEHLKLPLERRNPLWKELMQAVGRDLSAQYRSAGAIRDGRELVLPAAEKAARVLDVRRIVHGAGMTFGAADNEFQYLSDSECCCSGVDRFPGFQNWFRHQVGHAVRKCRGGPIVYSSIEREWSPHGSVDRYLNSRSRLSPRIAGLGSIRDHVAARWNDPDSPQPGIVSWRSAYDVRIKRVQGLPLDEGA